MNLSAYLTGSIKALRGEADRSAYFDFSRKGFHQSFIALALTLCGYYICALGVLQHRAIVAGLDEPIAVAVAVALPLLSFVLISGVYALTFVVCAYVLGLLLDCQNMFRPWVIVRHWTVFFVTFIAALGFALFLMGGLPFFAAQTLALMCYLSLLFVDIRLANVMAGQSRSHAVFIGCIIHAASLSLFLVMFLS